MKVGYARVSTQDQSLDLQLDALKKADCGKTFQDIISGSKQERKGLTEALEFLRPGDVLVVWRLDRLGRTLKHLIETVTALKDRGIGFMRIWTPQPQVERLYSKSLEQWRSSRGILLKKERQQDLKQHEREEE